MAVFYNKNLQIFWNIYSDQSSISTPLAGSAKSANVYYKAIP
jgi:hypothetical protein